VPLIHKASKKAFEHNIRAEMEANPSPEKRKQNIAIAYSVQRQAKKKHKAAGGTVKSGSRDMDMTKGGKIEDHPANYKPRTPIGERRKEADLKQIKTSNRTYAEGGEISAKTERRPMPDNTYDDAVEVAHNRAKKELMDDQWTDQPTVCQAQSKPRTEPIKHPRMVPTDSFSTRLYDQEGNLQESAKPGPYGEQPEVWENEEGPKRQGPPVHDMEDEHSTHKKPYAKGGEVEESDYAAKPNKYMDDLTDLPPSEDEGSEMANEHDEEGQDRQGPDLSDREEAHYMRSRQYHDSEDNYDSDMEMNPAHDKHSADDSETQPEDEAEEEHHASVAAAIMAKKERQKQLHSDSDDDRMVKMALGGELLEDDADIHSHGSMDSDDHDQADINRNADEDANEEDQASFDALRKENYSESEGLKDLTYSPNSDLDSDDEEMDSHDRHDMVSSIRRKMRSMRK
jgi:hypothetical protein